MDNFTISEAAFEFTVEKMQQTIRRQLIVIIVMAILFIASLAGIVFAFAQYESQFETQYYNVNSDKGNAIYSYVGEDGDIVYGESNGESS